MDATTEAKAYADGAPRNAKPLRLIASADGGFVAESRGGVLGGGKGRQLDLTAVLNCCHGGPGEDGTIAGAFDIAGIAYTGPTVAGAALGMDKLAFGAAVTGAGLPSLPRALVTPHDPPFDGPYIVKPRFGGSSIGIHVVGDWKSGQELTVKGVHYRRGAVIEPYRATRWISTSPCGPSPSCNCRRWRSRFAPRARRRSWATATSTSAARAWPVRPGNCRPRSTPTGREPLRDVALQVAAVAGVRGLARLDFLLDSDDLYVNEINTIPGSLARYLWIDPPIPFGRLLNEMLTEAERDRRIADATGADGTALRSAGSIASKLA